ncbi:hypothetical protein RUND412_007099, partial [Rhizina undulata]
GERSKILEWLSRVPFENHHFFIRPFRQDATGKWLLQKRDFISWKDSSSSSILWLHGIAGAGKTVLMSLVIDTFESTRSNNNAVVYFYCKHGEKDRQDPLSILSTLVKQLSLFTSPKGFLPQSVVSIFKEHEPKSGNLQLSECQELIASLAKNFIQTTIVIDALDECDKESRKILLTALEVIMKSTAGVIKFFVTSRPADDIELKLEGVPNVYIHSSDNSGDIAAFVRAEVDKCISEKSLLRGSVTLELKESVIEKLTSGADGMVERYLLGYMGKICGQSKESGILARRILKWIMCAQSPLAEAEIINAVSIEPLDFTGNQDLRGLNIQDLLDVCQNLIVMDSQLGVLRTAHFSVNEFLEHHFKMAEAHNHAAEICLTLMRRPKIYDHPPMPPPLTYFKHLPSKELYENQYPTRRPKIYDEPHPLRYYMFDHWAYHLRFSGDASNSLLQFQKEFFNTSSAFYACLQEVEKQWRVFKQYDDQLTPLWVASYYRLWAICKSLLRSNVDNCAIRNTFGATPTLLWAAAKGGHESFVGLLLEKEGIDINSEPDYDGTPLWAAASEGHESIVRLLLAKEGIDINSTSGFNGTPLRAAAKGGYESVVVLLLEKMFLDINSKPEFDDIYTTMGRFDERR